MGWTCLIITLVGAIIALVSWFGFDHNTTGLVVGVVIGLIGLAFGSFFGGKRV